MPKVRLRKSDREKIIREVSKRIVCLKEERAHDKALAKVYPHIEKAVLKKYPKADMDILTNYATTRSDYCGRVIAGDENKFIGFNFGHKVKADDWRKYRYDTTKLARKFPAFVTPSGACKINDLKVTAKVGDLLEAYNLAQDELLKAQKSKLSAYKSVILSARYVDDLEGVISLPSEFFAELKIRDAGLPAISGDIVKMIKSDTLRNPEIVVAE